MELIETKEYKTKVGLFIQEFGRNCTLFDCKAMLLAGTPVMYDQKTEQGWHIFRVITEEQFNNHYVAVPDGYIEDEIKDG